LRGVAVVGVIGAAAAAGAGTAVEFDGKSGSAALAPASKPVAMAPMAPSAMAGPMVVYVADTTSGVMDVYGGTGWTRVNNPAMISQLMDNLKLA
jgi:hypothetical protein